MYHGTYTCTYVRVHLYVRTRVLHVYHGYTYQWYQLHVYRTYVYVTLKVVPWYHGTYVVVVWVRTWYALKAINTQFASVSRTAPFILAHKSVEFPRNYCTEAELRCDRFLDLENRVGGTS